MEQFKRGRPKNPIGAERTKNDTLQKWNGKRWVSADYFDRTHPKPTPEPTAPDPMSQEPPKPEPQPWPTPEPTPDSPQDIEGGERITQDDSEISADLEDMASLFDQMQETPADDMPEMEADDEGASFKVKGEHLLLVLDIAGSFLAQFVTKKFKISNQPREDFKLTKSEREELSELAQACAETITFAGSDNPWVNFSAGYLLLMTTKVKSKGNG